MSYFSPYAQWPAGFLIKFSDFLISTITFTTASIVPEYKVVNSIHTSSYIDIKIHCDGGKQSDDSRPLSTTITTG